MQIQEEVPRPHRGSSMRSSAAWQVYIKYLKFTCIEPIVHIQGDANIGIGYCGKSPLLHVRSHGLDQMSCRVQI